jgi:hypothetical protein
VDILAAWRLELHAYRIALLRRATPAQIIRCSVGDAVESWRLLARVVDHGDACPPESRRGRATVPRVDGVFYRE